MNLKNIFDLFWPHPVILGATSRGAQGNIQDFGNQTCVSCVQEKHPIHCTIFMAPVLWFLKVNIIFHNNELDIYVKYFRLSKIVEHTQCHFIYILWYIMKTQFICFDYWIYYININQLTYSSYCPVLHTFGTRRSRMSNSRHTWFSFAARYSWQAGFAWESWFTYKKIVI